MANSIPSLPVVSLLNAFMTIQGYLRSATTAVLPPVIAQNPQYATLVTRYSDWQQDLWAEFWEGLMSNLTGDSTSISSLFQDGIDEESVMHDVLYDDDIPDVVALCDSVANLVTEGQPLLVQLESIAKSIQNADAKQVAQLTQLADQLNSQFDQQEDKLTQDAIDSGVDLIAVAVDVALAVGTEGEDIDPLVKGVIKIGEDAVDELELTDAINTTLSQLESAWAQLDQATADLAQVTLTCNQIRTVTKAASTTLDALQSLAADWSVVAGVTNVGEDEWANGGSAALKEWAARVARLSFSYATQSISVPATGRA
ncbi:hypothetical protein [Paraburkholderia oxyphila]|uniref:hypothetical protein n=1 Tax=Paraburkholderia oxyphila TaxID=614212 RepID=UPI000484EF0D|nr:hypothetical protein [Paraburkholderia oxyphila]